MIRQGLRGAELETFVVKRPYKDVASLIAQKAKQCLHVEIPMRECSKYDRYSSVRCEDFTDRYTATVVSGPDKTELHVQYQREGGALVSGKELSLGGKFPVNGRYVMVADLMPGAGGRETKIQIFGNQLERTVPKAVRHWVNGTSQGCPDFEREMIIPGDARVVNE